MEFVGMLIKDAWNLISDKEENVFDKFSNGMDKLTYFFNGGKK